MELAEGRGAGAALGEGLAGAVHGLGDDGGGGDLADVLVEGGVGGEAGVGVAEAEEGVHLAHDFDHLGGSV